MRSCKNVTWERYHIVTTVVRTSCEVSLDGSSSPLLYLSAIVYDRYHQQQKFGYKMNDVGIEFMKI